MNKETLLELTQKWERSAGIPEALDGSEEAKIPNAIKQGRREGKKECADDLRLLIKLLG